MNTILKNGLLLAASLTFFYVLFYFINPELNMNVAISLLLTIGLGVFFIYRTIKSDKTDKGGTISFGEAFAGGFATIALGFILYSVVTFVHLKVDTEYREMTIENAKQKAIEGFDKMAELLNMKGEDFDKAKEEALNQDFEMGIGQFVLGILFSLIFPCAIVSLITAAVVKKT